jgi:hypothetical protein
MSDSAIDLFAVVTLVRSSGCVDIETTVILLASAPGEAQAVRSVK